MLYQIEEKSTIHWESKYMEITDKDIKLYKHDNKEDNQRKLLETIPFAKIELEYLDGNNFVMKDISRKTRTFRISSKDMKDVIFTKLTMMQDQYFLNTILSENYKATRAIVKKERFSSISPIEKVALYFMTLFPILFNDLNTKLDSLKCLIATKKNKREIYSNLYHTLKALIFEIQCNSNSVYSELIMMTKEGNTNVKTRRNTELVRNKSILKTMQDDDKHLFRSDSFSMSFFNDEPQLKILFAMKTFERLEIQNLNLQYSIASEPKSFSTTHFRSLTQSQSPSRSQSHFQIEVKGKQKEKNNRNEKEIIKKNISYITHKESIVFNSSINKIDKYVNSAYDFDKREKYSHHIKLPINFLHKSLNALANKQTFLPIYLNEPITTLQKQCERMSNSSYLTKADLSPTKEMQICNIAAFLFGELSLDLNRYMEPMTPLQGETYEYYDNTLKYRFLTEEVSSNPPITAYIGESAHFILQGDTKQSTSINVAKSSFETNYLTPISIKLIQSNQCFKYQLPLKILKSQSLITLSIEYQGVVRIMNENNSEDYCSIDINQNHIDGKVFIGNKLTNLLTGSLDNVVQIQDVLTKDTFIIWKLSKKEKYLKNKIGRKHYYMPLISYNLNNSNKHLLDTLPQSDSRHRIDIKEYERGNIELAQEHKSALEQKQMIKEPNRDQYKPKYFSFESNDTYSYKCNYWNNK